jgi:hypothetical protein
MSAPVLFVVYFAYKITKAGEVAKMYGAILGDIIGSPYEFDRGDKAKDFPLFSNRSEYTDDTVMTIAVAEALLNTMGQPDEKIKKSLFAQCSTGGENIPTPDTAEILSIGLLRKIPSLTEASVTVRLCVCRLWAGSMTHSKKRATPRALHPKLPTTTRRG